MLVSSSHNIQEKQAIISHSIEIFGNKNKSSKQATKCTERSQGFLKTTSLMHNVSSSVSSSAKWNVDKVMRSTYMFLQFGKHTLQLILAIYFIRFHFLWQFLLYFCLKWFYHLFSSLLNLLYFKGLLVILTEGTIVMQMTKYQGKREKKTTKRPNEYKE